MLAMQAKNLNVFVALQFGRFSIVKILLKLLKVFVISNYSVKHHKVWPYVPLGIPGTSE